MKNKNIKKVILLEEFGELEEQRKTVGIETILLADDDAAVRKLIASFLQQFGYNIIEAIDGLDAVKKFSENQSVISMVILDMIMPNKNGKDACNEILTLNPTIKVLFISGYTTEFLKRYEILENIDFIMKPVHLKELLRKVREILGK